MGRDFPEFSPEKLVQNSHGGSQILSSLSHIFLPSFTRHKLEPFKLVGIFFLSICYASGVLTYITLFTCYNHPVR